MPFLPTDTAAYLGQTRPIGIYFRLGTPTPLRLWMGVNDVPIGIPSIDVGSTTYTGAGRFLSLPELEILVNGAAERVEFFIEGVSAAAAASIDASGPDVRNAPVHVGLAPLDERWQPLTAILPLVQGVADFWAIKQEPASGAETSTRTLILSVGFGDTGRSRPRRLTFTDAQQKMVYPTDEFCARVARYTIRFATAWPRF